MVLMMASPKVKMINVRLTPSVHESFRIAAELRGASMSSLLHQYIVRTIREEKELDPKAFTPVKTKIGLPLETLVLDKDRKRKAS